MVSSFDFASNVIGILVKEDVDSDSIEEIHELIGDRIQLHDQINLFVDIDAGQKITIPAMLKDMLFKFENAGHFKKIAMVCDEFWIQGAMEFKNLVMNAEVKTFSHDERLEAMNWIMN
ncbi:MAG: STAS/SEC14 domain-containing protein [Gillisia sp.]